MAKLTVNGIGYAHVQREKLEKLVRAYLGLADERHDFRVSWRAFETTSGKSMESCKDHTYLLNNSTMNEVREAVLAGLASHIIAILDQFDEFGFDTTEYREYFQSIRSDV